MAEDASAPTTPERAWSHWGGEALARVKAVFRVSSSSSLAQDGIDGWLYRFVGELKGLRAEALQIFRDAVNKFKVEAQGELHSSQVALKGAFNSVERDALSSLRSDADTMKSKVLGELDAKNAAMLMEVEQERKGTLAAVKDLVTAKPSELRNAFDAEKRELKGKVDGARERVQGEIERFEAYVTAALEVERGRLRELKGLRSRVDAAAKELEKVLGGVNSLSASAVDLRERSSEAVSAFEGQLKDVRKLVDGVNADTTRILNEFNAGKSKLADAIQRVNGGFAEMDRLSGELHDAAAKQVSKALERLKGEGLRILEERWGEHEKRLLDSADEAGEELQAHLARAVDGVMSKVDEFQRGWGAELEKIRDALGQRARELEEAFDDIAAAEEKKHLDALRVKVQEADSRLDQFSSTLASLEAEFSDVKARVDVLRRELQTSDQQQHAQRLSSGDNGAGVGVPGSGVLGKLQKNPWVVVKDPALGKVQVLVCCSGSDKRRRVALYCGACSGSRSCVHVKRVADYLHAHLR